MHEQPVFLAPEPVTAGNGPEPNNPPESQELENGHQDEGEHEAPVGRRVTRARARGAAPPPSAVPNPTPAQIRRALADERPAKKRAPARRQNVEHRPTEDEASLYFIVRQARASLQVSMTNLHV